METEDGKMQRKDNNHVFKRKKYIIDLYYHLVDVNTDSKGIKSICSHLSCLVDLTVALSCQNRPWDYNNNDNICFSVICVASVHFHMY